MNFLMRQSKTCLFLHRHFNLHLGQILLQFIQFYCFFNLSYLRLLQVRIACFTNVFRQSTTSIINQFNIYTYLHLLEILKYKFIHSMFGFFMDSTTDLVNDSEENLEIKQKLNMDKIYEAISKAEINMRVGEEGDHIVIFWGFSGAGKSTAILTLNGQEMVGFHHPITGKRVLMNKNPSQDEDEIRIENMSRAGTIVPAVVELKRFKSGQQLVKLWDMPGFGDNRGITITLINSYYIHRIFALHKTVKLVFTISYNEIDFSDKGVRLKQVLKSLMETLGQIKTYQKSMLIMITKSEGGLNEEMAKLCFQKLRKQSFEQEPAQVREFLGMIGKGMIPLVIMKMPQLQTNFTQDNPKIVTSYYFDTIKDFYNKIIKRKSTAFPKLKAPAMTPEEIRKCEDIAQNTKRQMDVLINEIQQSLIKYVDEKRKTIQISANNAETQKNFKRLKQLGQFIKKIIEVSDLNSNSNLKKQELLSSHLVLKKQFEVNSCLIDEEGVCTSLEKLYNHFIFVYFLGTFHLHERNRSLGWLQGNQMIQSFFRCIQSTKDTLLSNLRQTEQELILNISETIKNSILSHLANIQNELIYKLWANNFMTIPSYTLRLWKYTSTFNNPKDYFRQIRKLTEASLMKRNQIDYIIELIMLNEQYMSIPISADIISNTIIPTVKAKSNEIIQKATSYQTWERNTVEKVSIAINNNGNKQIINQAERQREEASIQKYRLENELVNLAQSKKEEKQLLDLRLRELENENSRKIQKDRQYFQNQLELLQKQLRSVNEEKQKILYQNIQMKKICCKCYRFSC